MRTSCKCVLILLLWPALALQAATTVTNIAGGSLFGNFNSGHCLFIKSDGSLWAFGNNDYGQLGDGIRNFFMFTNSPEEIVSNGVVAAAVGGWFSMFVKFDGSLWAMGYNGNDELGDGGAAGYPSWSTNRPEQIVSNGVVAVACGGTHSLFIKSDGSLWGVGDNQDGELGVSLGSTRPEEVVSSNVVAVACGSSHSLFLKSNGSLWGMGNNADGELGDGTFYNAYRPEQIVSSNVVAIAAGADHSLFLKSNGSLWAMGLNHDGELGDGTFSTNAPWGTNQPEEIVASNVVAIAGGEQHSLFVKSDGSLWATGGNLYGQLGDGTNNTFINQPEQVVRSGVVAIAAGNTYSLFLKSDGSLWGMGGSHFGGLGDGFYGGNSVLPEQIVPSPQPMFTRNNISPNGDLQLLATCFFGGNYIILTGTNLTQPLSQWTPVWTNFVRNRGTNSFTATLTNVMNTGAAQQFYILQSQ